VSARSFIVPPVDTVCYGPGAVDGISGYVEKLGGSRVFAVLSGSLAGSAAEAALATRLGRTLVGTYNRTRQHVPRGSVLEAAQAAREARADIVVSLGGGTPIDCAKAVALCLAEGITRPEQFEDYRVRFTYPATYDIPDVPGSVMPHIAVPTTLSGGEHTGLCGVTDEATHLKGSYSSPKLNPKVVILDPLMTTRTPGWLWAASGMRAVDHAVEGILSNRNMPFADALSTEALRLLSANLPASTRDPHDVEARTNCLVAAWLSIFAATNVGVGLSHGIGHQLAAEFDMIHGVTSAVMLPLVMEFNAAHTAARLRRIADALGHHTRGMDNTTAAWRAVTAVRELIASLDVPHTISAAGGDKARLPAIARHVMTDPAVAASARSITEGDVLALLEAAW
jgi:alcohol dehydrogenase class IV